MPTPLEDELGLGPVMHRVRRWSHSVFSRIGNGARPNDRRMLDPLTVNYAAWHEVRHTVREWPHYKEAANYIEILVSPEDWDEYWGIDTARKESSVAAYVLAKAREKGYWIAGEPQVVVEPDEAIQVGEVEAICQFAEPESEEEAAQASSTAEFEPIEPTMLEQRPPAETTVLERKPPAETTVLEQGSPAETTMLDRKTPPETTVLPVTGNDDADEGRKDPPTLRFVDAKSAGEACLSDGEGFRLKLRSGDCIGAVVEEEDCPPEVNVRLDSDGFPYVEPKQCVIGVVDGRWTIANYAYHGTMIVTTKGERLMLGTADPYPLDEGDVVYLGPSRPLRFELL